MRRVKVKNLLISSIYVIVIAATFTAIGLLNKKTMSPAENKYDNIVQIDDIPVIKEDASEKIVQPYIGEVTKTTQFYDMNENAEMQEKSLITYDNTYMPSTGTLYTSDNEFNVVAASNGVIKKISKDEMLGSVIELEHSDRTLTYYYSVKDISISENAEVKAGDILGKSSPNKLTEKNSLLFEVFREGSYVNPENYLNQSFENAN